MICFASVETVETQKSFPDPLMFPPRSPEGRQRMRISSATLAKATFRLQKSQRYTGEMA